MGMAVDELLLDDGDGETQKGGTEEEAANGAAPPPPLPPSEDAAPPAPPGEAEERMEADDMDVDNGPSRARDARLGHRHCDLRYLGQ